MTKQELKANLRAQANGLIAYMDNEIDLIEKYRKEEAEAARDFDKTKEEFEKVVRDRTLELSFLPEVSDQTDPKTGKKNLQWTGFLLQKALEQDKEVIVINAVMYEREEQLLAARTGVTNVVERLNVAKTEARLVSAMMEMMKDVETQ